MATSGSPGANLQEAATNFAGPARRYCAFVETMANVAPEQRVSEAVRLLSDLISSATELPRHVDVTDAEVEGVKAPKFDLDAVDFYYEVFDPFIRDELVVGSLSDDLGDIYEDLREGIDLLDSGHACDAIWHWRFHYDNHWGDHAVDALRALHRLDTGRGQDISMDPKNK